MVWSRLCSDVRWTEEELEEFCLHTSGGDAPGKYQVFEIAVAAVMARLRPDFSWEVTRNQADHGIDFVGRGEFLNSKTLGIEASLLVGGQCKKREKPKALVDELAGSLLKMGRELHPTFFIAAVSARLSGARISAARQTLEGELRRHCHILDRGKIEALFRRHHDVVSTLLRKALSKEDAENILSYLWSRTVPEARFDFVTRNDDRLVTGAPVLVDVKMTHNGLESTDKVHLVWKPKEDSAVRLISPLGDEQEGGLKFVIQRNDRLTPFETFFQLEFACHRPGTIDLGGLDHWMPEGTVNSYALPSVRVQKSHRVPFFGRPFGPILVNLEDAFSRAEALGPQVIALVGQGGVGKTRLGEEFGHVVRRRGGEYVAIDHPTTLEKPHQFLANLLAHLILKDRNTPISDEDVLSAVETLDPALAARARPSIEVVFSADTSTEVLSSQDLIAVFILLAHRRAAQAPILLHLRNLHWASVDVLRLLETLLWQLQQFFGPSDQHSDQKHRMPLMVILEGRVFEEALGGTERQTTRLFEGFLTRVACDRIDCPIWDRTTSHGFVEWLFQDDPTTKEAGLPSGEFKRSLTQYVKTHVGGTPFEIIEFTKLLRDLGHVDFNHTVGRVIAKRPVSKTIRAGPSLLETIRARLAYLDRTAPELGFLLRSVGHFDDAVPYGLFVHLRENLAPNITDDALERIGFLNIPEPASAALDAEVRFEHEHYFQAIQREAPAQATTQNYVRLYLDWLEACPDLSVEAQFLQARATLQQESADWDTKKAGLKAVIERAAYGGNIALQMRAVQLFVDTFAWSKTGQERLGAPDIVSACLQEVALCETLIDSGERVLADQRLQRALVCQENLPRKKTAFDTGLLQSLFMARIRLQCTRVQALRNNGEPTRAMSVTREIQATLDLLVPGSDEYDMSAMHGNFACALAYAAFGDMQTAQLFSGRSLPHARRLLGRATGALNAISTHGVITSRFDSGAALDQLLDVDTQADGVFRGPEELYMHRVHICRARVHRLLRDEISDAAMRTAETKDVTQDLAEIFATSFALGYQPQAAAAALLLGALNTVQDAEASLKWFSKSIVSAGRARQQETLFSAQNNFAQVEQQQSGVTERGTVFALSALDLMLASLDAESTPDTSLRMGLLRPAIAQMVCILAKAKHDRAQETYHTFPSLKSYFEDTGLTKLRADRPSHDSVDCLKLGMFDIYAY